MNNIQMVINTSVKKRMTLNMEEENIYSKIIAIMKVVGKMIWYMVKVSCSFLMEE